MANIIGPLIGAAIDRKDGDTGIKGAFIGSLAQSAVRAAVSLTVTVAVGWAIKKIFDNATEPQDESEA